MAVSMALNPSVDIDVTPDTGSKGFGRFKSGFLNRIKKVGENLRNTTREDVAFLGLSVGAGLVAKAAVLGALGVASGGATVVTALAGGAAVGLAKAAVNHVRDRKNGRDCSFFTCATLMGTASSAAISVATLGLSDAFEHFTGQTIGHVLGDAFNKVTRGSPAKLFKLVPLGNLYAADIGLSREIGTIPPSPVIDDVSPDAVAAEVMEEVEEDGGVDFAPANPPKPMAMIPSAPGSAKAVTLPQATANSISDGPNPRIDDDVRARALAWAKAMNPVGAVANPVVPSVPAEEVVSLRDLSPSAIANIDSKNIVIDTDTGVKVRMPAVPNIGAELGTVNAAIHEAAAVAGEDPSELDPRKMAAACVTELPNSQEAFNAQNGVLPNRCVVVDGKTEMSAGDYVIVRDGAEPKPSAKRGLRVLFAAIAERTTDFIGRAVTGETLADMSAEKLSGVTPSP